MTGQEHEAAALAFLGRAFRAVRERVGLSVRDAAEAASVSGRVISHAEHGKPVSAISYLRLCRLHDVDPFALLDAVEMHRREGAFHRRCARDVSRGTSGETRAGGEARP